MADWWIYSVLEGLYGLGIECAECLVTRNIPENTQIVNRLFSFVPAGDIDIRGKNMV